MQGSNIFGLFLLTIVLVICSAETFDNIALAKKKAVAVEPVQNKEYEVYGGLVRPQARAQTNFEATNDQVCGGASLGPVHLLTTQRIPNRFEWYVHTAFPDATCQLRISQVTQPTEQDFKVIVPSDGKVNHDGSFPCGRTGPQIESRVFEFNKNISCDHCVLEWIWRTPKGNVRQCSDIMVSGGKDARCLGMCQNGGVCTKGECVCPPRYSGKYCQSAYGIGVGSGTKTVLIVLLIIVLIVIAVFCACYYYAKHRVSEGERKQIYQEYRRNNIDEQHQFGQFDNDDDIRH